MNLNFHLGISLSILARTVYSVIWYFDDVTGSMSIAFPKLIWKLNLNFLNHTLWLTCLEVKYLIVSLRFPLSLVHYFLWTSQGKKYEDLEESRDVHSALITSEF